MALVDFLRRRVRVEVGNRIVTVRPPTCRTVLLAMTAWATEVAAFQNLYLL